MRTMFHTMRKPCALIFNGFSEWLTNINKYLLDFPGLDKSKNMEKVELNKIILHAVPNLWDKYSSL